MRNRPSITLAFAAALFFVSTSAVAQFATTIDLSNQRPRAGEMVTATIRSSWPDGCVPGSAKVIIAGKTIRIESTNSPCGGCTTVVTPYTLPVTFSAPGAGPYTIEYVAVYCDSTQHTMAARPVIVQSQACEFPYSLYVARTSIRVGDTLTLSWCDPTTQVPDNSFTVSSYRVRYARSPDGPFAVAGETQNRATTSISFNADPDDVGPFYFYVEAIGCTTTITGQCVPTVAVSNIVSFTVAAAAPACLPTVSTLCLENGRFSVTSRWKTPDGKNGDGHAVQLTPESGYFWFFEDGNVEINTKLLNACAPNNTGRFWFFAAGMTNVEVSIVVTDTKSGKVANFSNTQGQMFTTIADTATFNTCF